MNQSDNLLIANAMSNTGKLAQVMEIASRYVRHVLIER
jgi:hypothetical protein